MSDFRARAENVQNESCELTIVAEKKSQKVLAMGWKDTRLT